MSPRMPMAGDFASRIGKQFRATAPTMRIAPTVHTASFRRNKSVALPHRRAKAVALAGRTTKREMRSDSFRESPRARTPGAFPRTIFADVGIEPGDNFNDRELSSRASYDFKVVKVMTRWPCLNICPRQEHPK